MKKRFLLILMTMLLAVSGIGLTACGGTTAPPPEPDKVKQESLGELGNVVLSFPVFSDLHFGSSYGHIVEDTYPKALKDVMSRTENRISALVCAGDFTEGFLENYDTFMQYTVRGIGNLPVVVAYGNHEGDNKHAQYITKFGKPVDNVTTVNGYNFIVVGAHAKNTYTEEQAQWLDTKLAEFTAANPRKPVFVVVHHPVKGTHDAFNQENGNPELASTLQKYPQAVVITGHQHRPYTVDSFWSGEYVSFRSPNMRPDTENENKDPNYYPNESEYSLFRLTDKNILYIEKYRIAEGGDKPELMHDMGVNEYGIDGRSITFDLNGFYDKHNVAK